MKTILGAWHCRRQRTGQPADFLVSSPTSHYASLKKSDVLSDVQVG